MICYFNTSVEKLRTCLYCQPTFPFNYAATADPQITLNVTSIWPEILRTVLTGSTNGYSAPSWTENRVTSNVTNPSQ
ncbi:hypothetical protein AOLI_G00121380 [Acnodon oligacanthus]